MAACQIAGEMIDHISRVILRAINETRFASAKDGQPQSIHPRCIDDASVVSQVTLAIDHRHVEPAILRTKTGRPQDRTDLAIPQVEAEPCRGGCASRLEAFRRSQAALTAGARPFIEG